MGVKGLIKTFVVLSTLAVGALTAYHYYADEMTPSSAAFDALEEYNSVMSKLVTTGLDAISQYSPSSR